MKKVSIVDDNSVQTKSDMSPGLKRKLKKS